MTFNLIEHLDWGFDLQSYDNYLTIRAFKWELVVRFSDPGGFV